MKNLFVLALLAFAAGGVQAQTAGAGAGALSGSSSDSAAGASAGAVSNVEVYVPLPGPVAETRSTVSGTTSVRMAPAVTVTGPASGPCTGVSGGIGASWLGGGFGANLATVDKGCQLRESARMLAMTVPALAPEDQAEGRAMLMDTLRALYARAVLADDDQRGRK